MNTIFNRPHAFNYMHECGKAERSMAAPTLIQFKADIAEIVEGATSDWFLYGHELDDLIFAVDAVMACLNAGNWTGSQYRINVGFIEAMVLKIQERQQSPDWR